MLRPVMLAALAAALAAGAIAPAPGAQAAACHAGPVTVGGHPGRAFCGPAHAAVRVGGRTFQLRGGSCTRTAGGLTLNIGTVVPGVARSPRSYFGLTIGSPTGPAVTHGGRFRGGVVSAHAPGLS